MSDKLLLKAIGLLEQAAVYVTLPRNQLSYLPRELSDDEQSELKELNHCIERIRRIEGRIRSIYDRKTMAPIPQPRFFVMRNGQLSEVEKNSFLAAGLEEEKINDETSD